MSISIEVAKLDDASELAMKLELSEKFRATILRAYGSDGEAWLLRLPALVEKYLSDWNLKEDGRIDDLTFNFVVPVFSKRDGPSVLKLGPHIKGRLREARALQIYAGNGTVGLLKHSEIDGVSLLERAKPGVQLSSAFDLDSDEEATLIAADLMKRLLMSQSSGPKDPMFPHVDVWGLGFEKYLRETHHGFFISKDKVSKADAIFKNLSATASDECLLHGDLHHFNILSAGREPWLAIDPKGVWGDPAYEVGAFIRNPMPALAIGDQLKISTLLQRRLEIFSDILGYDFNRLWGWSYSQCILAAIWSLRDERSETEKWLCIADAIEMLERT